VLGHINPTLFSIPIKQEFFIRTHDLYLLLLLWFRGMTIAFEYFFI